MIARTPPVSSGFTIDNVKPAVLVALVLVLFTPALHGQAPFTMKRFGSTPVSDAEVAQIAELARSTGKRLWLLHTPNPSMGGRVSRLFLEPDVFGERVLRGRLLRLVADEPPNVPIRSPWRISESLSYVYIPIAGRQQGEIEGEHDLGWPFIVRGEFDDDTLIGIVEFIRSEPPIPMPAFLKRVPAAPIAGIARDGDAIQVGFREAEDMGHAVWLVRKDGRWVITRSETSVA